VESGKITERDLVYLMLTVLLPTVLFFLPRISLHDMGEDAWIVGQLAGIWGILVAWVVVALARRFPGMTLVEYLQAILGRPVGKLLGFLYVVWFMVFGTITLREAGLFLNITVMTETPIDVFMVTLLALAMYAVYTGLANWVRINSVVLGTLLLTLVLIIVLPFPYMDPRRLLPMGTCSTGSLITASLVGGAWRGESILASMFIPALTTTGKVSFKFLRNFIIAILIVGLLLSGVEAACTMVFGATFAGDLEFPIFSLAKMINLAQVFSRLEALAVVIWVLGTFIKLCAFFYCSIIGLAQVLGFKDFHFLIIPMGVLWLGISQNQSGNIVAFSNFISQSLAGQGILSFELVIPVLVYLIAVVLRRRKEAET
jgi:spore germination protein KB